MHSLDGVIIGNLREHISQMMISLDLWITKSSPSEAWGILAPLLGPPIDSRGYSIKSWLRGGEIAYGGKHSQSVLDFIPQAELWNWVNDEIEHRA
jgi:hypothetical protein